MTHHITRRSFSLAALSVAAGAASAQSSAYPTRSVKIIVAAAAGSSPDSIGRTLSTKLTDAWNQSVVVENVVGLGGITGTERLARQPADGYTIAVSTIGATAVSGALMSLPYDPEKDITPIIKIMEMPNLMVVHPKVPVKDLRELIAYVKQNPGKLRYGHPGMGTTPHLSGELLNQLAGVKIQGIPYKSSAQMMNDLLAGHYEILFHNSSVVLPHARSGGARLLGITSPQRSDALPEVPTVAEAGGLPGFAVGAWFGLYAPAGTPPEIINKINTDVAAILRQPDVKTWVEKQGGATGGGTPRELRDYQLAESKKWGDMIRTAGIKAE